MLQIMERIRGLVERPNCIRLRKSSSWIKERRRGWRLMAVPPSSMAELIKDKAKRGTSSSNEIVLARGPIAMCSTTFSNEHKKWKISTMHGTPYGSVIRFRSYGTVSFPFPGTTMFSSIPGTDD